MLLSTSQSLEDLEYFFKIPLLYTWAVILDIKLVKSVSVITSDLHYGFLFIAEFKGI